MPFHLAPSEIKNRLDNIKPLLDYLLAEIEALKLLSNEPRLNEFHQSASTLSQKIKTITHYLQTTNILNFNQVNQDYQSLKKAYDDLEKAWHDLIYLCLLLKLSEISTDIVNLFIDGGVGENMHILASIDASLSLLNQFNALFLLIIQLPNYDDLSKGLYRQRSIKSLQTLLFCISGEKPLKPIDKTHENDYSLIKRHYQQSQKKVDVLLKHSLVEEEKFKAELAKINEATKSLRLSQYQDEMIHVPKMIASEHFSVFCQIYHILQVWQVLNSQLDRTAKVQSKLSALLFKLKSQIAVSSFMDFSLKSSVEKFVEAAFLMLSKKDIQLMTSIETMDEAGAYLEQVKKVNQLAKEKKIRLKAKKKQREKERLENALFILKDNVFFARRLMDVLMVFEGDSKENIVLDEKLKAIEKVIIQPLLKAHDICVNEVDMTMLKQSLKIKMKNLIASLTLNSPLLGQNIQAIFMGNQDKFSIFSINQAKIQFLVQSIKAMPQPNTGANFSMYIKEIEKLLWQQMAELSEHIIDNQTFSEKMAHFLEQVMRDATFKQCAKPKRQALVQFFIDYVVYPFCQLLQFLGLLMLFEISFFWTSEFFALFGFFKQMSQTLHQVEHDCWQVSPAYGNN